MNFIQIKHLDQITSRSCRNTIHKRDHHHLGNVDKNTTDGTTKVYNDRGDDEFDQHFFPFIMFETEDSAKGDDEQDNHEAHIGDIANHHPTNIYSSRIEITVIAGHLDDKRHDEHRERQEQPSDGEKNFDDPGRQYAWITNIVFMLVRQGRGRAEKMPGYTASQNK